MAIQKDYKAIAGIIRQEYARYDNTGEDDSEGKQAVKGIAYAIAEYFASNSEWFNLHMFLATCDIE